MNNVHHSSKSAEHYTPPEIIELVLSFWGQGKVGLDPCSNSKGNPNFPAIRLFTKEDDGLRQDWICDTLFMNPPYGRQIGLWVKKLVGAQAFGYVDQAIALLPARTDTKWFDELYGYPACFVKGRLKFGGNNDPAPFPSVLFYLGEREDAFAEHFSSVGRIWRAY
jgi:hypothetical protein